MKRVKAACILQTLVFSQNPDGGYTAEQMLELNRGEVKNYQTIPLVTRRTYKQRKTA